MTWWVSHNSCPASHQISNRTEKNEIRKKCGARTRLPIDALEDILYYEETMFTKELLLDLVSWFVTMDIRISFMVLQKVIFKKLITDPNSLKYFISQ